MKSMSPQPPSISYYRQSIHFHFFDPREGNDIIIETLSPKFRICIWQGSSGQSVGNELLELHLPKLEHKFKRMLWSTNFRMSVGVVNCTRNGVIGGGVNDARAQIC